CRLQAGREVERTTGNQFVLICRQCENESVRPTADRCPTLAVPARDVFDGTPTGFRKLPTGVQFAAIHRESVDYRIRTSNSWKGRPASAVPRRDPGRGRAVGNREGSCGYQFAVEDCEGKHIVIETTTERPPPGSIPARDSTCGHVSNVLEPSSRDEFVAIPA